jgi:hypothetical protein
MASVNGNDFITDPNGSRRFLPFEVLNIDIDKAKSIDMDKVWAQAYSLFKNGFIYYFNDEEIQELQKGNIAFHYSSDEGESTEEQLIQEFFKKPESRSQATNYFTNAMIQDYIERHTCTKLLPKKIGEALLSLGFEKWQRTENAQTSWVYSVIQKKPTKKQFRNAEKIAIISIVFFAITAYFNWD